MMRSATAASTHESATSAAREAWSSLTAKMGRPDLLIVVATVGYDLTELVAELRSLAVASRFKAALPAVA